MWPVGAAIFTTAGPDVVREVSPKRRIAEFEECVGHRLVVRHLGSYRLTELGEELLPAAKGVEAAVASFERRLAACDKGLAGTVRVTCGSSLAACLRQTPLIDGISCTSSRFACRAGHQRAVY